MNPAVFFDRDGVLNLDHGYVCSADRLEWMPGCFAAVRMVLDLGYLAVVITNQSGIGRGYFSLDEFLAFNAGYMQAFVDAGCPLDGLFFCSDVEDSPRRKPAPGMIFEAASELNIDLVRSFFIGDKESDMEAAAAAGVRGFRFSGGDLCEFIQRSSPSDFP